MELLLKLIGYIIQLWEFAWNMVLLGALLFSLYGVAYGLILYLKFFGVLLGVDVSH